MKYGLTKYIKSLVVRPSVLKIMSDVLGGLGEMESAIKTVLHICVENTHLPNFLGTHELAPTAHLPFSFSRIYSNHENIFH